MPAGRCSDDVRHRSVACSDGVTVDVDVNGGPPSLASVDPWRHVDRSGRAVCPSRKVLGPDDRELQHGLPPTDRSPPAERSRLALELVAELGVGDSDHRVAPAPGSSAHGARPHRARSRPCRPCSSGSSPPSLREGEARCGRPSHRQRSTAAPGSPVPRGSTSRPGRSRPGRRTRTSTARRSSPTPPDRGSRPRSWR